MFILCRDSLQYPSLNSPLKYTKFNSKIHTKWKRICSMRSTNYGIKNTSINTLYVHCLHTDTYLCVCMLYMHIYGYVIKYVYTCMHAHLDLGSVPLLNAENTLVVNSLCQGQIPETIYCYWNVTIPMLSFLSHQREYPKAI